MQIKFLQTKEYSKIFVESLKDIVCYRIMFAHRLQNSIIFGWWKSQFFAASVWLAFGLFLGIYISKRATGKGIQ